MGEGGGPGVNSWEINVPSRGSGTKGRESLIPAEVEGKLYEYLGGIGREHGMKLLCAGGTEDHVHVILSLPGTVAVSEAVQLLKGGSSKWLHDEAAGMSAFEWQEGCAAFSVSPSVLNRTRAYIAHQKEHHRKKTLEQEREEFRRHHPVDEAGLGTG